MDHAAHLEWPFFDERHRALTRDLDAWAHARLASHHGADVDAECRMLVRELADGGWLDLAVAQTELSELDARALCLAREVLARHSALADFAFVMQGLGTAPVALAGTPALRARVLGPARAGRAIAAFALTEPDAGSDVAAMRMTAVQAPGGWSLNGTKTWISNGGIADHYVVFARTEDAPGTKGISAFFVEATTPGLSIAERLNISAPHPLATLRFENCTVAAANMLGGPGDGFKIAMATLDLFRPGVGAAALGFARRAMAEAVRRALARPMLGGVLADLQITQATLADMALSIDASALLVYRAAWTRDVQRRRTTGEAAMAKLYATEAAQQVVDSAVQICGALGVALGGVTEALYREVRALRIYEGASEVQKLIIARQMLAAARN